MEARILVVDDDEAIRKVFSRFIAELGYSVDLADAYDSALALALENEYDIILTDKNMPDAEGNQDGGMMLLEYVKENIPSTEVVMITGHATIETAIQALKLGAFDYIMKPISIEDLREKIERILVYRNFINSEDTLHAYRTLHNQVLDVLQNRNDLPQDQVHQNLRTIGAKIDHVFGLQKQYEIIIQTQAEALGKIEEYVESLKDALPQESPYYTMIERISEEAQKRI